MRHQFNTVHTFCGPTRTKKCTEPCKQWNIEKFTGKSSMKFKILEYIARHPNCKRKEVVLALHPELKDKWNGWHSSVFANLLHKDYVDYNANFEYTITPTGTRLLMSWMGEC